MMGTAIKGNMDSWMKSLDMHIEDHQGEKIRNWEHNVRNDSWKWVMESLSFLMNYVMLSFGNVNLDLIWLVTQLMIKNQEHFLEGNCGI